MIDINFNIRGTIDNTVFVYDDRGRTWFLDLDPANSARGIARLPDDARQTGGHLDDHGRVYHFLIPNPGGAEAAKLGLPGLIDFTPETPQKLTAHGEYFFDESGKQQVIALHSDFRAYRKWLDGDRDPIHAERYGAGSDGPRVFLTCDFLFKLGPHVDGPRFYTELPGFADYCCEKGIAEFVCYTDRQLTGLGTDVWPRVNEQIANRPILSQLVNEYFKNGVDPRAFAPFPNGCPQSPGSFVDGMYPVTTWPGGYHAFNPARNWKWPATVAITLWELKATWPGVWLIDEPIGAAEHDEPGRRATQADWFGRMGADCRIWGSGGVFHSQSGLQSEPWGPTQRRCAEAFFVGVKG